jgi:hypothetical protein
LTFGIGVPVVAGLAIGIAFIAIFAATLKPVNTMTDDDLRKLVSSQYPQFQALKERYPNTVERIERYDWVTYVHYEATKEPIDAYIDTFPGPKTLSTTLTIRPMSRTLDLSCGSGVSIHLPATVNAIKTSDCLETP